MSKKHRTGETSDLWKYVALIGAFVIVGVLVVAALTRPLPTPTATESTTPAAPEATAEPEPEPEPEPEQVVLVGDSNTEVGSSDFNEGDISDGSWAYWLLTRDYDFAGGWASGGSTSVVQAEGLDEVENSDILVAMTGTNDLGQGVAFDQTAASLDTLAVKSSADRVVLLAIPPRDEETTPTSSEFNDSLEELAEDRGWEFFDGLEFLRSPDGGFEEGTTSDGIHLSVEAQRELGETVADYLSE